MKRDWDHIEQLNLRDAIKELKNKGVITKKERNELDEFNDSVRNSYIHYNIKELIKDMEISELPSINIETGEITIYRNVKPSNNTYLWFSAKKY